MEIPSRAPMPRGGVGWTGQGPFIYAPSHHPFLTAHKSTKIFTDLRNLVGRIVDIGSFRQKVCHGCSFSNKRVAGHFQTRLRTERFRSVWVGKFSSGKTSRLGVILLRPIYGRSLRPGRGSRVIVAYQSHFSRITLFLEIRLILKVWTFNISRSPKNYKSTALDPPKSNFL